MREDELQRQMAEVVADHADQAMPRRLPPSAAGGGCAVPASPRELCC